MQISFFTRNKLEDRVVVLGVRGRNLLVRLVRLLGGQVRVTSDVLDREAHVFDMHGVVVEFISLIETLLLGILGRPVLRMRMLQVFLLVLCIGSNVMKQLGLLLSGHLALDDGDQVVLVLAGSLRITCPSSRVLTRRRTLLLGLLLFNLGFLCVITRDLLSFSLRGISILNHRRVAKLEEVLLAKPLEASGAS